MLIHAELIECSTVHGCIAKIFHVKSADIKLINLCFSLGVAENLCLDSIPFVARACGIKCFRGAINILACTENRLSFHRIYILYIKG